MNLKHLVVSVTVWLTVFFGLLLNARAEPVSFNAINSVIMDFPVAVSDRSADQRITEEKRKQLETISVAIEKVVQEVKWPENDRVSLAAYLLTIGYWETRYSQKLHHGAARAHSYGIWQITPGAYGAKRENLIGLSQEQTNSSAMFAAKHLSTSWQCGTDPADHFTSYYGGVPCKTNWKTLSNRVRTYWWVRYKLVKYVKDHEQ